MNRGSHARMPRVGFSGSSFPAPARHATIALHGLEVIIFARTNVRIWGCSGSRERMGTATTTNGHCRSFEGAEMGMLGI